MAHRNGGICLDVLYCCRGYVGYFTVKISNDRGGSDHCLWDYRDCHCCGEPEICPVADRMLYEMDGKKFWKKQFEIAEIPS